MPENSNSIARQKRIAQVLWPLCWPVLLIFPIVLRYKIENHDSIRVQYKKLVQDETPLVICSNHLTYLDSVIHIWALGDHFWYWLHFKKLTWNLPAIEYRNNPVFRVICYLSKCIFIKRGGNKKQTEELIGLCQGLLNSGEVVTIFPEGHRSRTGWFERDRLKKGTGKIISGLSTARVLCVYVRSHKQKASGKFPPFASTFYFQTKLIEFAPRVGDRKASREITKQIGQTIADLEDEFKSSQCKINLESYVNGETTSSF